MTPNIQIFNNHTVVLGLRRSGKSTFVQWLISEHDVYENTLAYDVVREHDNLNRYKPEYRRGEKGKSEFAQVIKHFITDNHRSLRPDVLLAEELSRYAPSQGKTPEVFLDLTDLTRHYGVGVVGVGRRPAQLDTDMIELAENVIIFRLVGKNDVRALNDMVDGLGDDVKQLDDYHFIHVAPDLTYTEYGPVPEMDTTGEL